MLIKLLVSAFERAKSKLTGPDRVSSPSSIVRFHLDSHRDTLDDETELTISVIHQERQAGRVSLSKWLCHTTNKTLVRRSSSWRSLKDRPHLSSRTRSVDELDRKASKQRHRTRPPSISQGGADSGYSEDSLPAGLRPLHMSCPHCHCEQHSSFSTYPKSVKDLSTSVSSTTTIDDKASAPLSSSRSYPHLPPSSQPIERRQRRRHFSSDTRQSSNFHVFGELNLAAIERDSLRTSFTLTTRRRTFLVWHEYHNRSLLSSDDPSMLFSVTRGDQVRLLRRIGKSTLLVQKEDDGSVGFLPQTCLADDQIQSFLSVKGLRETVL